MRLDNEEVFFKVYKPLNLPLHNKDLCMITTMKVDECGLVECATQKTSLACIIDLPKSPINPKIMKKKEDHDKTVVERDEGLDSTHSRGQKRVKIWPLIRRKGIKEYD